MKRLKSLFLLIGVSLLAGVGVAELGASRSEMPHARATLIADVDTIEPGKSFRLGVRYEIDPHWHIYWINPGDTGLNTKIEWSLPPEFQHDGLHWPVPARIEQSGLISYAYEREVVLFTQVKAPDKLDGTGVSFKASSSWLVCSDSCIPGKADLELTLPVGPSRPSDDKALFDQYARATPAGFFAGEAAQDTRGQPLNIAFNPPTAKLAAGASASIQVILTPAEGKNFTTKIPDADKAALFPLVPDDFSTEDPSVTEHTPQKIIIEWPIAARTQAQPGEEVKLYAALRVSMTDGSVVAAAALPVQVSGAETAAAPAAQPTPAGKIPSPADSVESSANDSEPVFSFLKPQAPVTHSIAYFLLLAFIGGLILNVMPCVLPVISLKVMSFVRQSGDSPRRRFNLGLMYAAGVLASFGTLAAVTIALNAAGTQAGWGFQMTQPRFVIVLAAVVLAFALSLFGVFSVELPGRATNAVAQGAQGEGYGGAFMNGVLATLLATPCTAPFLAPAAGFLLQQTAPVVLAFFLTVGLGLAAPYVLLAANPRWLRWLPKPGRWMETFKQLMGFAMLGTLVWLLWVLGSQLGNNGTIAVMIFLLFVALACWILGLPRSAMKNRLGLPLAGILLIGGYMLPESTVRAMHEAVSAGSTATPSISDAIPWEPFSVARVEELTAAGKTIFVDFTADWCVTCKANERLVLETDAVREALRKHEVVALRGDWTTGDPTISRVLKQFGSSGVPLYVIFPGGAPGEPIVLPTALTKNLVIENLARAAETRVARN